MFNFLKKKNNFTKKDLEKALALAPTDITFASAEAEHSFQNTCLINDNDYGISIIQFAKNWARLMEAEMLKGRRLNSSLIKQCEELADTTIGNSGFTYSCARNILIVHWKHGRKLMTRELIREYGHNPNMSDFYATDDHVREHREKTK